ncbi:hypothetical protein JOQ06_017832, partial [Pogonophryne albipinna]
MLLKRPPDSSLIQRKHQRIRIYPVGQRGRSSAGILKEGFVRSCVSAEPLHRSSFHISTVSGCCNTGLKKQQWATLKDVCLRLMECERPRSCNRRTSEPGESPSPQ